MVEVKLSADGTCGFGSCRTHLHLAPTALISNGVQGAQLFWGPSGTYGVVFAFQTPHIRPVPPVDPGEVQPKRRNRWHMPPVGWLPTG